MCLGMYVYICVSIYMVVMFIEVAEGSETLGNKINGLLNASQTLLSFLIKALMADKGKHEN